MLIHDSASACPKILQTINILSEEMLLWSKTYTATPMDTAKCLCSYTGTRVWFNRKKINLPDRTCTPYSVCGNKNAADQQQQGISHQWDWAVSQTRHRDLARLCGFIYSFLALRNHSHFLFISLEKKTWANKQWERSWKGQRG